MSSYETVPGAEPEPAPVPPPSAPIFSHEPEPAPVHEAEPVQVAPNSEPATYTTTTEPLITPGPESSQATSHVSEPKARPEPAGADREPEASQADNREQQPDHKPAPRPTQLPSVDDTEVVPEPTPAPKRSLEDKLVGKLRNDLSTVDGLAHERVEATDSALSHTKGNTAAALDTWGSSLRSTYNAFATPGSFVKVMELAFRQGMAAADATLAAVVIPVVLASGYISRPAGYVANGLMRLGRKGNTLVAATKPTLDTEAEPTLRLLNVFPLPTKDYAPVSKEAFLANSRQVEGLDSYAVAGPGTTTKGAVTFLDFEAGWIGIGKTALPMNRELYVQMREVAGAVHDHAEGLISTDRLVHNAELAGKLSSLSRVYEVATGKDGITHSFSYKDPTLEQATVTPSQASTIPKDDVVIVDGVPSSKNPSRISGVVREVKDNVVYMEQPLANGATKSTGVKVSPELAAIAATQVNQEAIAIGFDAKTGQPTSISSKAELDAARKAKSKAVAKETSRKLERSL